jgi:hypothetical protein
MSARPAALDHVVGERWRLVRKLGEGAGGTTYEAEHLAAGTRATLKLVSAQLGQEGFARLHAEHRALDELLSDHIPRLLDFGADDGLLYLAYDLVDGTPLDQLGVLAPADALAVAYGVAAALAEAHAHGIVHRDVKPANVIVPHDERGQPQLARAMLVDFGVAGVLERRGGASQTRTGQIFGSPLYMSPEQLSGTPQSPATDVYGLGALIYTLIFGRAPFQHENLLELMAAVLTTPLSFPAEPPLTPALRDFLARCLAKDARARPADGRAAHAELQRLRGAPQAPAPARAAPGAAPLAPAPSQPTRTDAGIPVESYVRELAPPRGRAPWPLWLLAGCALLGMAGFFFTSFFLLRAGEAAALAGRVISLVVALLGLAISWLLAFAVHRSIEARRPPLGTTVTALLGRAQVVGDLSQSLAIDVERLFAACRELDQQILAKTLSLMLGEYRQASASSDRQAALMKVVELMEKLQGKLAPWYVRRQALLTWAVGLVGSLLSGAKVVSEVVALLRG